MKTPTLHARRIHKLSGVSPSPPSQGGEGEAASKLTRVVTGLLVSDRVAQVVCI